VLRGCVTPAVSHRAGVSKDAGRVAEEVEMKRIIAKLMLLVAAATLATVGPGAAGAAFADNGVIESRD